MLIFKIKNYLQGAIRIVFILYLVTAYFVVTRLSKNRFTRHFVSKKYKHNDTVLSAQERLKMLIERLGPTFVKFGQILADRPDLIPENIRAELRKLHSTVKPFDHQIALQLIEQELGGPISDHFRTIEPECLGSASIGQVYKAVLKTGEHVVVKVQRPRISNKIKIDIRILRYIAEKLKNEFPELEAVDLSSMVDEFSVALMDELNYINEAANTMRFGELFRDVPFCKVPRVYSKYTTSKLIVLEYVDGIVIHNKNQLKTAGLDPEIIAENGTRIFMKMILEHGFFHADPHSGNILVQGNNKIALIDFGMVGTLKPKQINLLISFMLGIAGKNARQVADALINIADLRMFKDIEDLEFRLQHVLDKYSSLNYKEIKLSQVANECLQILVKFQIKLPNNIFLLLKTLATIEKLGYELNPEIPLVDYIKPYTRELLLKRFTLRKMVQEGYYLLKNYVDVIQNLPQDIKEIVYNIKKGRLIHDVQLGDQDKIFSALRNSSRALSSSFLTGFILVGTSILIAWNKNTFFVDTLFVLSSIYAVWLLIKTMLHVRRRNNIKYQRH